MESVYSAVRTGALNRMAYISSLKVEYTDITVTNKSLVLVTFNHIFLQVYRKTNCPSYKEKFLFGLEASEFAKRSLTFYVYASDKYANTLIGEAELKLCDVTPRQPVTTWLTLTDTGQVSNFLGDGGAGLSGHSSSIFKIFKATIFQFWL
jgi:hypothetical protein